jgi:VWFA-related protein
LKAKSRYESGGYCGLAEGASQWFSMAAVVCGVSLRGDASMTVVPQSVTASNSTNHSRALFSLFTAAFLLLSATLNAPRAQTTGTQTPLAGETRILLTAIDKNQQFVTTLRADDLRLIEDGRSQPIAAFSLVTDRSVSLAIMIDASASQEGTLSAQKTAATTFVDTILRPNQDQAAIVTFTGLTTVQQPLTNNLVSLREAILRAQFVPPPGYVRGGFIVGPPPPPSRSPAALAGQTAIWDSVIAVCNDVLSPATPQKRRAIVLLTDGVDTISKSKLADAVEVAVRREVAIYSIGMGGTDLDGIEKNGLRKLSERTGGRAFFPKKPGDLAKILAEIGRQLRTQYMISYNSNRTSGAAKIRIEFLSPAWRTSGVELFYPQTTPRK